jgi:hypothetical protein
MPKLLTLITLLLISSFTWSCAPAAMTDMPTPTLPPDPTDMPTSTMPPSPNPSPTPTEPIPPTQGSDMSNDQTAKADVTSASASGESGAYQFSVEISSPDLGCQQYADWWEVLDEQGQLIYRRILAHSHVNEQPFTRSGGPVSIEENTIVWVRAHMNPGGYGGTAFKGSVQTGFEAAELPPDFAMELEETEPLPDGCAF